MESAGVLGLNILWVSIGEAAVMLLLGLPFLKLMEKRKIFSDILPEKE